MLSTKKCFFCGAAVRLGAGVMYVKNDGTVLYFCSSKCRKNSAMNRDARRLKWTKVFRKQRIEK